MTTVRSSRERIKGAGRLVCGVCGKPVALLAPRDGREPHYRHVGPHRNRDGHTPEPTGEQADLPGVE